MIIVLLQTLNKLIIIMIIMIKIIIIIITPKNGESCEK